MTILEVDDDVICNELTCLMLVDLGVAPEGAFDGQEALAKIRARHYDLVLMDVRMPRMSGLEATRIIRREISTAIPIVAVTALNMPDEQSKCIAAGANEVLVKPFEVGALEALIRKYDPTNIGSH